MRFLLRDGKISADAAVAEMGVIATMRVSKKRDTDTMTQSQLRYAPE